MKIRVITSVVALAVFIAILFMPPVVFPIALAAVIFIMLHECYSASKADAAMKTIGFISAALFMVSEYVFFTKGTGAMAGIILLAVSAAFAIMVHMILIIAEHGKRSYTDVLANGFVTLYVVFCMSSAWIAKQMFGTASMLMIFICAWSTDTFAYLSGKAFGKHKLIPHVSPNKTVEGSVGGVIGAMVICIIYLLIAVNAVKCDVLTWGNIFLQGAVIGLAGGVFSQIGDLIASSIKRDTGVKDFGRIFPGHGGFMDRFDSVMFIAPIITAIMAAAKILF